MLCTNGHENEADATFCQSCGAVVKAAEPVAAPTEAVEAPAAKSSKKARFIALGAALVVIVVIIVAMTGSNDTKDVKVTVEAFGRNCSEAQTWSNLYPGALITMTDSNGTKIGSGALSDERNGTTPGGRSKCTLSGTITVSPNATTYSLHAGKINAVTWTKAEMVSDNWSIDMLVGNTTSSGYSSSSSSGYSSSYSSSSSSGYSSSSSSGY
jgi:hypothetical protein